MPDELFINDIEEANRLLDTMRSRNASLEMVCRAIAQNCNLRLDGLCDIKCRGRILCDVTGLVTIQEMDRQAGITLGPPAGPSSKNLTG